MSNTSNPKNRSNSQPADEDWFGELIWAVVKGAARVLWLAILFPFLGVPVAITIWVGVAYGVRVGVWTAWVATVGYGMWAFLNPPAFDTWVVAPVRQGWLSWWRYQRNWDAVCTLHGLNTTLGQRVLIPALQSVNIGAYGDILTVRVVTGQSVNDWQKQAPALAAAWRADRLVIRARTPGELQVIIMRGDVLARPLRLRMPTSATPVDLAAVRVGVTESQRWWRLPVLGHHILVAGATGAGKGSVLWSLIAGLAPEVKSGRVRLCVIDPKGGMELGAGAPMFSEFCVDVGETTAQMLRRLVALMQTRAARLRGHTRLHTPTVDEPLIVVVIDEVAALTAYVTDRKVRGEIEQLLGLLLSQGRAVGISVVAAVQDPAKDTLPVRQLFTVRIGLRMTEGTQTAMVLGQGARDAGAECELVGDGTPGIGYTMVDGTAQPMRVRAFYVSNADIVHLARTFPCPRPTGGSQSSDRGAR